MSLGEPPTNRIGANPNHVTGVAFRSSNRMPRSRRRRGGSKLSLEFSALVSVPILLIVFFSIVFFHWNFHRIVTGSVYDDDIKESDLFIKVFHHFFVFPFSSLHHSVLGFITFATVRQKKKLKYFFKEMDSIILIVNHIKMDRNLFVSSLQFLVPFWFLQVKRPCYPSWSMVSHLMKCLFNAISKTCHTKLKRDCWLILISSFFSHLFFEQVEPLFTKRIK